MLDFPRLGKHRMLQSVLDAGQQPDRPMSRILFRTRLTKGHEEVDRQTNHERAGDNLFAGPVGWNSPDNMLRRLSHTVICDMLPLAVKENRQYLPLYSRETGACPTCKPK